MSLGEINTRKTSSHTAQSLISSPVQTQPKKDRKVDFRIQEDIWALFVEKCAEKGTTASERIRLFIMSECDL